MSILIKGMEMPKKIEPGLVVEFAVGIDGKRYARLHHYRYGAMTDWLEAVPVPPHGDLIDRDELSKSLDRLCDRVCQYSKAQRNAMCRACPLGDAFAVVDDDAPTIISASEDDET